MKHLTFLLSCLLFAANAHAQDFLIRRANTVGNWKAYVANDGSMFHLFDTLPGSPGARWFGLGTGRDLVYGAGLWIGGIRKSSNEPAVSYSYGPASGSSVFVPGSIIYGGAGRDTSAEARERYRVYRSTDGDKSGWPIRSIAGTGHYIDNPADRPLVGDPFVLGDEDLFAIYKDTDPTVLESPTHSPLGVEVRTTCSVWNRALGADVVVVHNEVLYQGSDTLTRPLISLVVDGDVDNPYDDKLKGILDEAIRAAIFYTYNSPPGSPILGFALLRGYYSGSIDNGVHGFRYWNGQSEDPVSDSEKYAFMAELRFDTATTAVGDPRLLLTSAGEKPLAFGDTVKFDYAMFAFASSAVGFGSNDSFHALNIAGKIRMLYLAGRLDELSVSEDAPQDHQPLGKRLFLESDVIPLDGAYRILDLLGRTVAEGIGPIAANKLPAGYFSVLTNTGSYPIAILR